MVVLPDLEYSQIPIGTTQILLRTAWNRSELIGIRSEISVQLGIQAEPISSDWFRLEDVGHRKVLLESIKSMG